MHKQPIFEEDPTDKGKHHFGRAATNTARPFTEKRQTVFTNNSGKSYRNVFAVGNIVKSFALGIN